MLTISSCNDESTDLLNDQKVETRSGGNTVLNENSPSFKRINNIGHTTFNLECGAKGPNYLSTWIEIPYINGKLHEYNVEINGVVSDFTLKPNKAGWQSLMLTDGYNRPTPVELMEGNNSISIISQGRESINIEQIKTSLTEVDAQIDSTLYEAFCRELEKNSNVLKDNSITRMVSAQSNEIYDYALDIRTTYTYEKILYDMEPGMHMTFTTTSNIPHVIELRCGEAMYSGYNYSWSTSGTTTATLDIVLPNWWGNYTLRIRALNHGAVGTADLTYIERWGSSASTFNHPNVVVAGNVLSNRDLSGSNYMIASASQHSTNLNLFLIAQNPGAILMTEPYQYIYDHYKHSTYNGYVSNVLTSTNRSSIPSALVDVYMGLEYSSQDIRNVFSNLRAHNSFKSGYATAQYNCISWSVERTDYWEWPGDRGSSYYNSNLLTAFDNLYRAYGYTRSGATADNAGIALWATSSSVGSITHASVRKNANTTKPHGPEWESKCGQMERVMHERDALNSNSYGKIYYYYRPTSTSRTMVQNTIKNESINLSSVNTLNASLKVLLPSESISEFEMKYSEWKKTWINSDLAVHSNPKLYAQSKEYSDLLNVCEKYGKASWPLFVEKLASGDILAINLVRDLTISENEVLMDEIKFISQKTRSVDSPLPSMYSNYINYCVRLLNDNNTEIQKAIYNIK